MAKIHTQNPEIRAFMIVEFPATVPGSKFPSTAQTL